MKKAGLHLGICLLLCVLIGMISTGGQLYAGFAAAFLGAAYLLAAWLRLLKASATDLPGRLRRKSPPGAPYFHRRDKTGVPGVLPGKGRLPVEDSLEEESQSRENSLPLSARLKAEAVAFALCGAVMLGASLLL